MRGASCLGLLWLFVTGGCGGRPPQEPSPAGEPKPNFVLVMSDDQGWGDVGYNGHPVLETPVLDEMAEVGFRFNRFYAAAPVCSPTRGSVMTGRHPNRFGCFQWGRTLRPQEVTIAEALREVGYRTGHFGKWHLGSVRRGSPVNPGSSGFDRWISAPNFFDNDPILSEEGEAVARIGESSRLVAEDALRFIRDSVARDDPFLAVVWFGSPHRPHEALPEDRAKYPAQPEELQHYLGEITALDRAVGMIREELGELGIRSQTLLWFNSDNGALPEGSNGGFRGRKGEVYEGGLLVPAVLEWPGRLPSEETSVRATTSDIFPTLLELAGAEPPSDRILDGISLVPLFEGRMNLRSRPLGFWDYPEPGIRTPSDEWMRELLEAQAKGEMPEDIRKLRLDAGRIEKPYSEEKFPGHSAWIEGDWKLHRVAGEAGDQVRYELYDLASDPHESVDLLSREEVVAVRLKKALEAWQRSVVESLNGGEYPSMPEVAPETPHSPGKAAD